MQFVDIEFPRRIALGAQRFPGWKTALVQTSSGFESADQQWSKARHRFDLSLAVRVASDYDAVLDHFHSVRGRARAFPFRDILDYKVEAVRGVLLDDGDSPTTGYHLGKRYGTGDAAYFRRITRPATGTVAIYRLRGATTTNITGSSTITYGTATAGGGWVTFTGGTIHAGDVLSWSGQFFVPCRYDTDELPSSIVNRRPGGGELLVQCDSIPVCEVRD
jgi:uncharacterized protein (TIGR02217 family)